MSPAATFYQMQTTVSFTLLGLWFVVMSLPGGPWRTDPDRHRSALPIALHFFLPGTMGLVAVLSDGHPVVWRVAFLAGATVGLITSVRFLGSPPATRSPWERRLRIVDPLWYGLVAAATAVPVPVAGLVPLQIEGLATATVFVTGLVFLWLAYAESPAAPRSAAPPATPTAPAERSSVFGATRGHSPQGQVDRGREHVVVGRSAVQQR